MVLQFFIVINYKGQIRNAAKNYCDGKAIGAKNINKIAANQSATKCTS
jgi:hypothetical protein